MSQLVATGVIINEQGTAGPGDARLGMAGQGLARVVFDTLQFFAMETIDMAGRFDRIKPQSQQCDSQCLICSKIFYGQTPNKCSKCGGAIVTYGQGLVSHRYAGRDGW